MDLHDVAIIGASISGASLATCLGAEGLTVALIDKDRFPRRKACGEGLSNLAMDALTRMGFETGVVAATGLPYHAYRIALGKRSFEFAAGPERSLKGTGIQRYILDKMILDRAGSLPTVSILTGTRVTSVRTRGENYELALSDGNEIRARFLVLADGANSPGSRQLGVPRKRDKRPLYGISFILEGEFARPLDEVVVVLKDGFEINCTPVSETRLNVTFLTDQRNVKRLQEPAFREKMLREAALKSEFSGAPMSEPLQVGPVNPSRRSYTYRSAMLVGDAAETLDPVAGMGMTHGVLMAEIAAEVLISILRDGVPVEKGFREYEKRAEKMTRPIRGFTRLTASLLRNPARCFLVPGLAATFFPGMIRDALNESASWLHPASLLSRQLLTLVGI